VKKNAMTTANKTQSIPSAGRDFEHLLDQDVVIAAAEGSSRTGAQAIEPDHSPRAARSPQAIPRAGALADSNLQREVEQFLYLQAELLDGKHWQAFIDLFTDDGVYWMPVTPDQTEWEGSPSIFAEDKLMMEIRKGRVSHPNAWSQAPLWETNHLVSHVAIVSASEATIGFTKPLASISFFTSTMLRANTIGGVTMVCQ